MITHSRRLSSTELRNWMNMCSSIEKVIRHPIRDIVMYSKRAILDAKGQPVPLEQFLRMTGQRKLVEKRTFESKSPREKLMLKAAKTDYRNAMKKLFGDDWKALSRRLKVFNVPTDEDVLKDLQHQIANL